MTALLELLSCKRKQIRPEGLVSAETTPNALRHTFARRYLDQNPGDLIGLARILGHESLETTKVYLRPTSDDLAQRMEQMSINAYE